MIFDTLDLSQVACQVKTLDQISQRALPLRGSLQISNDLFVISVNFISIQNVC